MPQRPEPRVRRAARALAVLAALTCLVFGAAAPVVATPQHAESAPPAAGGSHETQPAGHGEGEGEGGHGESPWALVARLFNFAILAGGLVYLLRSPLMGFLEQRGIAVRSDLRKAADLKREAAAQLAQVEERMRALPSEIEALKHRGVEEIRAEEARIQAIAEQERRRLLEQAKREIESQLRIAERDLRRHAGVLAVDVATHRVRRAITESDHARLVDRYVAQVRH
jgi:F-type H+-transporting ATPase subunit b